MLITLQQPNQMMNAATMYSGINNGIGGNNSGSGDSDSWFVSYADILLLLLTFFVLLFAFSRVEGVGANDEHIEEADKVMASSMEKNDAAELLIANVAAVKPMQKPIQKPLSAKTAEAPYAMAEIGDGSVSVVHELIVNVDSVASNEGIKIDALFDENAQATRVATVTSSQTLETNETQQRVIAENITETIPAIAMYDVAQDNASSNALLTEVAYRNSPNVLAEANLVALTVDEQLAKLSAGLTSSEVEVSTGYQSINIELNNKILFPLGEAQLLAEGQVFLNEIVTIMDGNDYFASVEGHTDSTPIATPKFPSNWELSSSRATSVARYLISQGVAANRLRAIGYADTKPKADNGSGENRARNRRVSITFHYDSDAPLS